jgi:hypothetical protein
MKKYGLMFMSASILLAGCSSMVSSNPLMMFVDSTSQTKEMETSLTEMASVDSFQTMGRLGHLPMGLGVGVGDEATAEDVLVLQETFGLIHETMQEVHALRFQLALEGDVLKTIAVSFQQQGWQLNEMDANVFNELVATYNLTKDDATTLRQEAQSIRRTIGETLRVMNRPRTFDGSQLTTLQTLADSLYQTSLSLPPKLRSMQTLIVECQNLLEGYFEEGTSPISDAIRNQLNQLYRLQSTLNENRASMHSLRIDIKQTIQSIRMTLSSLQDQAISLNESDQATLSLLRVTIREQFDTRHNQQTFVHDLYRSLRGLLHVAELDTIESTLTQLNTLVENQLVDAHDWLLVLQSFHTTLLTYLA